MTSSTLIKFVIGIATLVPLLVEVSSFLPPVTTTTLVRGHASPTRGYQVNRYIPCHLTPKRNSDKESTLTSNKITGIGGLNVGNAPFKTKKARDATIPQDSKPILSVKKNKIPSNNEASDSSKIPWSKVILAFLIPWRNPNSLFLYMLLIVSVLGKLNEHPH